MSQSFLGEQQALQNLAVLWIDERTFLLPQNEIRTLQPLMDLDTTEPDARAIAWLPFIGYRWPAYCVDGELQLRSEIPATRQVSVLLSDGDIAYALLCDRVESLGHVRSNVRPLPKCMHTAVSPWAGLILLEQRVVGVTSTALLARFWGLEESTDA